MVLLWVSLGQVRTPLFIFYFLILTYLSKQITAQVPVAPVAGNKYYYSSA